MTSRRSYLSPDELGRLGLAGLERYETEGEAGALTLGLAQLVEAVETAPGHPDRLRWWYGLGSGYESRAEEERSIDDYDRAIGWYRRVHAELSDGLDRTIVVLALTGAQWSRYRLARYGSTGAGHDPDALVAELVSAVGQWPLPTEDAEAVAHIEMIRGLAHHERFEIASNQADLDAAVRLLSRSVPVLPDDAPWLAVAVFTLATAYWNRYRTDGDAAVLDRAIDTVARVLDLADEKHPTWLSTHEHRAVCLTERWYLAGDRADLDAAIGAVRFVLGDDEDGWMSALAGQLLRERAELDGDPAHLAEAARLLEGSVDAHPERTVAADRWLELGRVHHARWTLGQVDGSLDAARRCTGTVLNLGLPDGEPVVDAALAELATLAERYHDRGGLALAEADEVGGDPAGGLADVSTAVRIARTVLARVPAVHALRVPVLLVASLAQWAWISRTHDADALRELDRWTGELAAAQPESGELHDIVLVLRGFVAAAHVQRDGSAGTPEREVDLRAVLALMARSDTAFVPSESNPALPARLRHLMPRQGVLDALERVRQQVADMPADHPERPRSAALLATTELMAEQYGLAPLRTPEVIELLTEARRDGPGEPGWQVAIGKLLGAARTMAAAQGRPEAIDDTIVELKGNLATAGEPRDVAEIQGLLAAAYHTRWMVHGDLGDGETALRYAEDATRAEGIGPQQLLTLRGNSASMRAEYAFRMGDPAGLAGAVADLQACVDQLPEGDRRRSSLAANLLLARNRQWSVDGGPAEQPAVDRAPLPARSRERADRLSDRALRRAAAVAQAQDLGALAEVVDDLTEAAALAPEDPNALRWQLNAAMGHWVRAGLTRSRPDAERAVVATEEVVRRLDGVGHPLWSAATFALARAYRLRDDPGQDDRARSRALGAECLRGHAMRVLLQSGTEHATAAGRPVPEEAVEVAGWSVQDGDAASAALALDACRGLVLHAASTVLSVPDALAAAGQPDLAEAWRQRPDTEVPSDLRRRVIQSLTRPGTGTVHLGRSGRLLDPPALAEIRRALDVSGAQALVYLVPRSEECPAVAVVVPAAGDPRIVALPTIGTRTAGLDPPADPARYRDAVAADPPDGSPPLGDSSPAALRDTVQWAWRAVMGRVLECCRSLDLPRPYRLVLVPMGELGLVPWHAAQSPSGRYVLSDAVISYAASGRLFCEAAARSPIAPDAGGLVVGNPTGDLGFAGTEAAAIRRRFHPGARYLGGDEAGAPDRATPARVLEWLRGTPARPGGILHLACHGRVEPGGAHTSYLMLAAERGGSGRLSAEDLIQHARRTGSGYQIGTVVLAACSTGASGRGYDEAFSLATAFLATGVRSVVGSHWRVPDEATSLLMYMLHHYLVEDRIGVAAALRVAQLWMLDPDRRLPDRMPDDLRSRVPGIDPDDLSGWAGFTHVGRW